METLTLPEFHFQNWISEAEACEEATLWAQRYSSAREAWDSCTNPSWLFYAVEHAPKEWLVDVKSIHLCALEIASLHTCPDKYFPTGWTHQRVLDVIRKSIETGDKSELAAARAAAWAAAWAAGAAGAATEKTICDIIRKHIKLPEWIK